jgi:hypothetical protein
LKGSYILIITNLNNINYNNQQHLELLLQTDLCSNYIPSNTNELMSHIINNQDNNSNSSNNIINNSINEELSYLWLFKTIGNFNYK